MAFPYKDGNTNLFNELFIEFVQSIFFRHHDIWHSLHDMRGNMPSFYEDSEMVKGAIGILLMRNKIFHKNDNGEDYYKASPEAIQELNDEIEQIALNKSIDLKIKELTKDSLTWQRIPQKYWYWVLVGGIFLGGFITKIFEAIKPQQAPSLNRQEIQVIVDSSATHKNP